MTKGLLFDLDHTFYDYEHCHKIAQPKVIKFLSQAGGWSIAKVEQAYLAARQRVHQDLQGQAASHSRLLYFQKTIETLTSKTLPQITLQAEEVYWRTFLDKMRLADGALDFLKTAQKLGLKMAIVTNLTAQIQMRKLKKLGLSRYIDFLITSEEAGCEKPDRRIFQLALEKIRLTAGQVCYIGDEEVADIAGARQLGIKTIYLHRDPPQDKKTVWAKDWLSLKSIVFDQ